jgi:cytochrome bd-type quinol oxidase subunit 1
VGSAVKTLQKAAKKESGAAFLLAWTLRKGDLKKVRKYMDRAMSMRPAAKLPVRLAWVWIFLERLPKAVVDVLRGRKSGEREFLVEMVKKWRGIIHLVLWLVYLYAMIVVRVFFGMFMQEEETES